MASPSFYSSGESDDNTLPYEPPTTQPKRQRIRRGGGRGQGRATGRGARGRGTGRVQRETALHVAATLLRKKERLRELVAELREQEMRTILVATVEKNPDILWDILDSGHFDGHPPGNQEESAHEESEPPEPGPSSTSQQPSWCVCGNCREMPTQEERLCCGKAPEFCITGLPHFQLVVLYETVLRINENFQQDIFGFPEDVDPNRGFRHAAYRSFVLWRHGRLGAGNRLVVPSCCVVAIRHKFPDPFGNYTGYIPGRLG